MAVVPIRIVGDPVLHTATTPVTVAADGSLPADLAQLIATMYDTMDAASRSAWLPTRSAAACGSSSTIAPRTAQ